jgi:uncharacterized protein YjeT (DUF2065 family)
MMMMLPSKRWKHFAALVLIGDGIMALVHPQRDAAAWKVGPKPWRALMQEMHDRPVLTRVVGAAQVAAGVWWALDQEKRG